MGKHKKGRQKIDNSGMRSLPMLKWNSIYRVPYQDVRSLELSAGSYSSFATDFSICNNENVKAYRAILKASINMWTAWMSSINTVKIGLVTGMVASLTPILWGMLTAGIHWNVLIYQPLLLLTTIKGIVFKVLAIEIVLLATFIWITVNGLKVAVKTEKATFLLSIVEDIIEKNNNK